MNGIGTNGHDEPVIPLTGALGRYTLKVELLIEPGSHGGEVVIGPVDGHTFTIIADPSYRIKIEGPSTRTPDSVLIGNVVFDEFSPDLVNDRYTISLEIPADTFILAFQVTLEFPPPV